MPGQAAAAKAVIQGFVFLAAQSEVSAKGKSLDDLVRFGGKPPVDVSRQPLLQDARFVAAMEKHIGATLNDGFIRSLTTEINTYLAESGRGLSLVSIPPQDATSGVVQVLVMQPRLGKLAVEGAKVFPEASYREAIRLQPGDVINTSQLNEDLGWIKRSNPFRSAAVVAQPGKGVGETDLTLQVSEKEPWSFNVGADNTGVASTGRGRLNFGATWGNAFKQGHLASYTLATDPDFKRYIAHSLGYTIPLHNRATFNLSANYATIRPKVPDPLEQDGYSGGASARYDMPLAPIDGYTHNLSFGADYKIADTNVLFSATPVFGNRTEIFQGVLGYNGSHTDAWGRTSFSLGVNLSPGGVSSRNSDTAFATSRALARSDYHYETFGIERLTNLPKAWVWILNLRGQVASGNLLGSEQLAATGIQSVRGIEEGRLYGDRGVVVRNEVTPPAFRLGDAAQGQIFGFVDAAEVSNVKKVAGETSHNRLASAGIGLRFSVNERFNGHVEAGLPVRSNVQGINTNRNSAYVHLGAGYQF